MLDELVERWRIEDPDTTLAPILACVGTAAHDDVRDAWPWLVLELRGDDVERTRRVIPQLVGARIREAAPYLLSLLRRPAPADTPHRQLEIAVAYTRLSRATPELIDEWLPYLDGAPPRAEHLPRPPLFAGPHLRQVAARLLWTSGTDERVFEAFLRNFVETYSYSEYAFRRHGRDPRVVPVLLARLAEEERRGAERGRYSTAYEILARYLVRLGVPVGREAVRRYMRAARARRA